MLEAPGLGPGEAWALRLAAPDARESLRSWVERSFEPAATGWLSLETQQAFYEQELRNDDTDILDRVDPGTPALQILTQTGVEESRALDAAREVGLAGVLRRGYRLLSTGESRLLLLLREVLTEPGLVVFEQPFEGLDARWRLATERLLSGLLARGGRALLLVERWSDVPACATHWGVWRSSDAPAIVARGEGGSESAR